MADRLLISVIENIITNKLNSIKIMLLTRKILVLFALSVCIGVKGSIEEEEHGVIYANRCEACKILANELEERLKETGRSHDVIEVG